MEGINFGDCGKKMTVLIEVESVMIGFFYWNRSTTEPQSSTRESARCAASAG